MTSRSNRGRRSLSRRGSLVIATTLGLSGSPISLLQLLEAGAAEGWELEFLVPSPGPLADRHEALGSVRPRHTAAEQRWLRWFSKLGRRAVAVRWAEGAVVRRLRGRALLANTCLNLPLARRAVEAGGRAGGFVQEMEHAQSVLEADEGRPLHAHGLHALGALSRCCADFWARDPDNPLPEVLFPAVPIGEARTEPRQRRHGEPVQVGFCGTLEWRKGADLFLQVARLCRSALPPGSRFVWKGASLGAEELRRFNRDRAGYGLDGFVEIEPADLHTEAFYRGLDIFLALSREESLGLVVIEAAVSGVPTVGMTGGGGIEELQRRAGGVLVPYGDSSAAAKAVLALASEPGRARELAVSAAEEFRRWFEPTERAAEFSRFLGRLAGG